MTKFVKHSSSYNPTHIPQKTAACMVYIVKMPSAPHILIVDDHREIRDLISRSAASR